MSAGYLAAFQKTTIVLLPVSREVCYGRFSVNFLHALLDLTYYHRYPIGELLPFIR